MKSNWADELVKRLQAEKAEVAPLKRNKTFYLRADLLDQFERVVDLRGKGRIKPGQVLEKLIEIFIAEGAP